MRTSLLSTTVIATCFAASAFAADLPSRTAPVAPVVYVPAFTWTGFYIGLNAGGAWAGSRDVTVTGPGMERLALLSAAAATAHSLAACRRATIGNRARLCMALRQTSSMSQ